MSELLSELSSEVLSEVQKNTLTRSRNRAILLDETEFH
jgi:hypothetical protein